MEIVTGDARAMARAEAVKLSDAIFRLARGGFHNVPLPELRNARIAVEEALDATS